MDSGAPPASGSRCGGAKVFGGPPFTGSAGQWPSPARRRSRAGKNTHGQNDGRVHSDWVSKVAIHTRPDRKSTRLNSSHSSISYAVFCLKKKKNHHNPI